MKMFRKPAPPLLIAEPKSKEEHPYIQGFKKIEEIKKKEMEQKMNQAKMTPEEKRLKERLEKDKKLFVRVEKGKETRYKEDGKGFAQVVDVSWGGNREKEKEKEKEKNLAREKEREKYRQKEKEKEREREKDREREREREREKERMKSR